MALPKLQYTKTWESATDFPTEELTEAQVRADMQLLHDETKTFINDTLVASLEAETAAANIGAAPFGKYTAATVQGLVEETTVDLQGKIDNVVAGVLPDDAVTTEKIRDGAVTLDKIAGGVIPNKATQAEAIAGTDDVKYMTPAKTKFAAENVAAEAVFGQKLSRAELFNFYDTVDGMYFTVNTPASDEIICSTKMTVRCSTITPDKTKMICTLPDASNTIVVVDMASKQVVATSTLTHSGYTFHSCDNDTVVVGNRGTTAAKITILGFTDSSIITKTSETWNKTDIYGAGYAPQLHFGMHNDGYILYLMSFYRSYLALRKYNKLTNLIEQVGEAGSNFSANCDYGHCHACKGIVFYPASGGGSGGTAYSNVAKFIKPSGAVQTILSPAATNISDQAKQLCCPDGENAVFLYTPYPSELRRFVLNGDGDLVLDYLETVSTGVASATVGMFKSGDDLHIAFTSGVYVYNTVTKQISFSPPLGRMSKPYKHVLSGTVNVFGELSLGSDDITHHEPLGITSGGLTQSSTPIIVGEVRGSTLVSKERIV